MLRSFLLAMLSIVWSPQTVEAYERQTVENSPNQPLFWRSRRVVVRAAYQTCPGCNPAEVRDAILRGLAAWTSAGDGCTDISLVEGEPPTELGTTLYGAPPDGENRIVWRNTEWLDSHSALALTLTVHNTSTGELKDADIDVNSVDFAWTTADPPALVLSDVQNTLTHELGHVLGLAHSLDPTATMAAMSPPGEISKRDLAPDDIRGVCTIYPTGQATSRGIVKSRGQVVGFTNCRSATGGKNITAPNLILVLMALTMLTLRRRARDEPEGGCRQDCSCS